MSRSCLPQILLIFAGSIACALTSVAADKTGTQPAENSQARLERVKAQVDAGEFGPALQTAEAVADAAERTRLFKLVAEGQLAAGEFSAAQATSRRLPTAESRVRARADLTRRNAAGGGGSGANFGPLMELIQQQTGGPPDGPWQEVDGEGGTMSPFETGVRVNPHGLLYRLTQQEQTGRLTSLGVKARSAALNQEMSRSSALRCVSLTRLEKAVAERIRAGQPVLESMRHLAGLSQVHYIFVDTDNGELLVAGPGEGWQYNANGLPVGVSGGRPTLQLDDLVTVLRTFAPTGKGIFGCSINPRTEGLKAVKQFVEASQAKGPVDPSQTLNWLKTIQKKMGLQDIEIYGVPANTRTAQVLVEADYRMKLIGIGKLDGGKEIPSIFTLIPQKLQKNPPPLDALRWWLTMKYEAVLHSPDRDVFEIRGSTVLVQSENQLLTAEGQRIQTGKAEDMNRKFAENFTAHYSELAKRDLVFADLQNIFDLGMVAALCQHEHLAQRIGWDLGVFAIGGDYRVGLVAAPKTVESVLNHRIYNGRDIVVQVAGGVRADLVSVVRDQNLAKEDTALPQIRKRGQRLEIPAGRWWWDAAE